MGIWYCTREEVKDALDYAEAARTNAQIDRAIESSSRSAEGFLNRVFYPTVDTRYFDWPINGQYARPWRLWLDRNEVISLTSVVTGASTPPGTSIPLGNINLEPNWSGPPFNRIEISLGTASGFGGGVTYQRDIAITGVFGFSNDVTPAGVLAAAITTTSVTTVDVTDSNVIGVGNLVYSGTELMNVTGKMMLTTGQTLQTPLTAAKNNESVVVTDGTAYAMGELILLDSERMRIEDITGNTLNVKRAWDGSTLAAHIGSTIYAPRRLTVERGVLGTTAATHLISTALTKHIVPGLVKDMVLGDTIVQLLGERSGYARTVQAATRGGNSGLQKPNLVGTQLDDIRGRCYTQFARQARTRAV